LISVTAYYSNEVSYAICGSYATVTCIKLWVAVCVWSDRSMELLLQLMSWWSPIIMPRRRFDAKPIHSQRDATSIASEHVTN